MFISASATRCRERVPTTIVRVPVACAYWLNMDMACQGVAEGSLEIKQRGSSTEWLAPFCILRNHCLLNGGFTLNIRNSLTSAACLLYVVHCGCVHSHALCSMSCYSTLDCSSTSPTRTTAGRVFGMVGSEQREKPQLCVLIYSLRRVNSHVLDSLNVFAFI